MSTLYVSRLFSFVSYQSPFAPVEGLLRSQLINLWGQPNKIQTKPQLNIKLI